MTFFFNSFTIDGAEKCFNRIDEWKKIPKSCLINIEKVKTLRKGIDCICDVEISNVENYFFKNAKYDLEILLGTFNTIRDVSWYTNIDISYQISNFFS